MFDDEEDDFRKKKKRKRSFDDIFNNIEEMIKELMENPEFFENLLDPNKLSKFKTSSGDEIFRPFMMGWSVHVGPDGKPVIRKFGHDPKKSVKKETIDETREPIVDILNQDKEIVIIIETPGVNKKDIKLKTTETEVTVKAGKKFKKTISLPESIIPDESKANYNNGLLEVRLLKASKAHSDETTIHID